MQVIEPVVFNSTQVLSSNATEIYADYAAGTSYSKGDRVHYSDYYYESLVNTNVGNTPNTSPTQWLNIGPCNHYAMFDTAYSTQTISSSPLTVVVEPGVVTNSVALLNLVGTSVYVEVKDSELGSVVYTKTIPLESSIVLDYYTYFFEPFDFKDTVLLTDIPPYASSTIKMILTGDSTVKIGNFLYGNNINLGLTQYGLSYGIRDYSIKETDQYGNTTLLQRAYSRRMEPQVLVDNTKLRYITRTLDRLRASPTLWVGTDADNYDPTIIFGFYRDYNIDISYPTQSLLRLEVEGMT